MGSVFSVKSFAAVWNMGYNPKTTFSDGDYICLERTGDWTNGSGSYLVDIVGGNSVSTSATDERIVLKLIAATETGWSTIPAFYLQNVSTKRYLTSNANGNFTAEKSNAVVYSISVGDNSFTLVPASEADALPLFATTGNAIVGKAYEKGNAANWKFIAPESDLDYVSASYNNNSAYAICYPFNFLNDPDVTGASVYTVCGKVLGDDNKVTALKLHEVSNVAAGQPVIIIVGDREAYDA